MSTDSSEDLQRVLKLCDDALAKAPEEREAFLSEACKQNPELRKAVDSLLVSVGNSNEFLDVETDSVPGSLVGELVGDYRILKRLGAGGMGSVFLAEREKGEFEQRVAIKMVRRYMMSKELIQRFDSERQLLAALQHPYVAQLIDGGTTEDGVPYLVMEYVEGLPVDVYCDEHKLDLDERIDLIKKIAIAVQAAHQNLIVHRDLKPANVLVTHDGIPKLLDFGIAKLVDPSRKVQSGHTTMFGHQPMTPDYSSPEQILEGTVTTASDIYSLGVLSYELLTGARPYQLNSSSHPQLMKSVEALTVEKPSDQLARQSSGNTQSWAAKRSTTPQQLGRDLSGDLDRIVLKAMHKDPEKRYESVGAFVRDFDRYLDGLPVEASDDTLGYRVGKFVSRNKFTVGAATVTMMAIVAALGFSLWQANIARDQSIKAQAQLVRAEAVSGFLGDILLSPSVNWDGALQTGPTATMSDVLAAAETKLDSDLTEYPEVRVELYHRISEALNHMEQLDDALRVQQKAVDLAQSALPSSSELQVDAYYFLGAVQLEFGDTDDAIESFNRALEIANAQTDEPTLRKLYIGNDLAVTYGERHEFEQSLEIQEKVIEDSYIVFGPGLKAPHSLGYTNLATSYISLGRLEEGKKHLETALEAHELYADQTGWIGATIRERYARLDILDLNFEAARDKYLQAIERYDSVYGDPNSSSAETKMRLADMYINLGNIDGARTLLDQVARDFAELLEEDEAWSYHLVKGRLALLDGDATTGLASIQKALDLGYEIDMSRFDRSDVTWRLVQAMIANGRLNEAKSRHRELLDSESAWIPKSTRYKQAMMAQEF